LFIIWRAVDIAPTINPCKCYRPSRRRQRTLQWQ